MDDYKCAIINENGIDKVGDSRSEDIHTICLLEEARKIHPDNQYFKMLNVKHLPSTISYYLTEAGDIVFLNTTNYRKEELKKYGRSGIFFLPSVITNKHIESLEKFLPMIEDFKVEIKADFSIEDGILMYKTISTSDIDVKVDLITLIKRSCLVTKDSNNLHI